MRNTISLLAILLFSVAASAQGWLELPAAHRGDKTLLVTQTMSVGRYSGRSHTFLYDPSVRISRWVAYPLNAGLIGEGRRGDGWHVSEALPASLQANLFKGFAYGSGYDRGHQIPSADRLEPKANESTFVYINATPQDHGFNAGIWAELEKVVRTWAKRSDTLYVVTGAVPSEKNTVADNDGRAVNIPVAYYKAVLRRNTDRLGRVHWTMNAVLLPHADRPTGTWQENLAYFKSQALSIDMLEAYTGEDLFPNLAALIGREKADELEKMEPAKAEWWWK